MKRGQKSPVFRLSAVVGSLILLAVLTLFCYGFADKGEQYRQREILQACRESVMEYRALYGVYPPAETALWESCGFFYDTERYRLRYTYYGEQIFPGIGLYRKGNAG